MANFLLLCWEFFKTGLFSIGGGLATIPFLQEMSLKYGWFSLTDLTTMSLSANQHQDQWVSTWQPM